MLASSLKSRAWVSSVMSIININDILRTYYTGATYHQRKAVRNLSGTRTDSTVVTTDEVLPFE